MTLPARTRPPRVPPPARPGVFPAELRGEADVLPCCLAARAAAGAHDAGAAPPFLPVATRALDDPAEPAEDLAREARRRGAGMLGGFTDAHTHLFPESIYRALWRWFDANLWDIAFRGDAEQVLDALVRAGAGRVVALVYAHKPGVAPWLNQYLAELCRAHPRLIGVGTVMPGEPDARAIARDAVRVHGLRGIKLHCHVQRLAVDDPRVLEVLAECEALGVPAVVHCGREPAHTAYGVDTHAICNVARTRAVLRALPRLRLVVPHVGADEFEGYFALLGEHEGLYLDTSMSCAEYFAVNPRWDAIERHADRVMYGSDFPIVPYEVDRELRLVARRVVSDAAFERLVRGTARAVWGE